jgi:hypothetical protein
MLEQVCRQVKFWFRHFEMAVIRSTPPVPPRGCNPGPFSPAAKRSPPGVHDLQVLPLQEFFTTKFMSLRSEDRPARRLRL